MKKKKQTHKENKLVITHGERQGRRGKYGDGGVGAESVTMWLYEIMCVKLPKIIKVYKIKESFKKERLPSPYDWPMLIHKLWFWLHLKK